jgi:alkylation response protein AidB-like acyl-CoA dehydrogenase
LVEPRYDFDIFSINTTAVRDGARYVLNGEKCYVPLARESELVMVYASLNAAAGPAGVDAFLLPRDCPGLVISEREKNMGIKALATYALALKESYQAKNYVAAAAVKITDNAVQVLGGHGYIREHPVEMWLRNARGFASFEGLATV